MRAQAPGAAWLGTLAAVDPLHFSTFYRRARFHRDAPQPAPPTVLLDVTTECPLACTFCFASGTQGSGRRLDPKTLVELEKSLSGVPRVVLIGGEPLTHPEIGALLRILAAHHDEIEIYTNGLALPDQPARRKAWLHARFAGLPARVTLTLAVDRFHREQMGDAVFASKVAAFLHAEAEAWPVAVRLNVTADGLHSTGYLTPEAVLPVLAELHPELVADFAAAVAGRRMDERYQLNPIVRLGRGAEGPGEWLKAEDALFSPEVVLTPQPDGALALLGFLPATWMAAPPPALCLGSTRDTALDVLLADVVARRFELETFPELRAPLAQLHADRLAGRWDGHAAETLRLHGLRARLADWPAWREPWLDGMAARLAALCGTPGQAWDLGTDRRIRRLSAPVLRRFVARHMEARPAQDLIGRLAALVAGPIERGGSPAFVGYAPRPGLLTDAPDAPIPLCDAPLDLGVDAPHLGDALVRPRLVLHVTVDEAAELHVALDGLGEQRLAPGRSLEMAWDSQARLHGAVAWLLPERLRGDLAAAVDARLARVAGDAEGRHAELAQGARLRMPLDPGHEPLESTAAVWKLLAGEAAPVLQALDGAKGAWLQG